MRVNNTDVFHVDRRFWTSFRSRFPATGPRERAFHSATVIGNYMVVYGKHCENCQTLSILISAGMCIFNYFLPVFLSQGVMYIFTTKRRSAMMRRSSFTIWAVTSGCLPGRDGHSVSTYGVLSLFLQTVHTSPLRLVRLQSLQN